MNFGNIGAAQLILIGLAGVVFRILLLAFAIWVVVVVRRVRREISAVATRLDALEATVAKRS